MKLKITEFLVTAFYLGKIRVAPGTFGSLAAFPIAYMIVHFSMLYQVNFHFDSLTQAESILMSIFLLLIFVSIALFILGVYLSFIYLTYTKEDDPKEVVIDEVVGQLLTLTLSAYSIVMLKHSKLATLISNELIYLIFIFLLPFCLFRFFDIIKPWPIKWFDKNIKGSIGIMLDDIIAALFAVLMQYAITFMIIDQVG
jgi:phosphatidylglycerophosphatase A